MGWRSQLVDLLRFGLGVFLVIVTFSQMLKAARKLANPPYSTTVGLKRTVNVPFPNILICRKNWFDTEKASRLGIKSTIVSFVCDGQNKNNYWVVAKARVSHRRKCLKSQNGTRSVN